jgi:hypothetical protein
LNPKYSSRILNLYLKNKKIEHKKETPCIVEYEGSVGLRKLILDSTHEIKGPSKRSSPRRYLQKEKNYGYSFRWSPFNIQVYNYTTKGECKAMQKYLLAWPSFV